MLGEKLLDFNTAVYQSGEIIKGSCKMEDSAFVAVTGFPSKNNTDNIEKEGNDNAKDNSDDDDDDDERETGDNSDWDIQTVPVEEPNSSTWGECKLPINPSNDVDLNINSGMRFGTKKDTYLEFHRKLKIKKRSEFEMDFRTTKEDGVMFYIANERNTDFITLFMRDGHVIYGFNCGSGANYIETENRYDDGQWHRVKFARQGNSGSLHVDDMLMGETKSFGNTKNLDVLPEFYLGGLHKNLTEIDVVQKNLLKIMSGFVGCLRRLTQKGQRVGRWKKNNRGGVIPCSEKVESGYFFGGEGGYIQAFRRFRVGLDFDITMEIKPRNISGILLAIQGRKDYLVLELVDGAVQFTVDNGRGAITSIFKPDFKFGFCDGNWHRVHAVKAKNVVTLSVNSVFAQPGIGVPGVSSTDTNHGLYLGGHPKQSRGGLRGLNTKSNYVGCMRNFIIETRKLKISKDMLKGDILAHVCPTI